MSLNDVKIVLFAIISILELIKLLMLSTKVAVFINICICDIFFAANANIIHTTLFNSNLTQGGVRDPPFLYINNI